MITWSTYILAKCPITGKLLKYSPEIYIEAPTKKLALQWAQDNGLGYLHIGDQLVKTFDSEGNEIDFDYYLN
jgi:hypothetical protein